jgi:WG containing repeat
VIRTLLLVVLLFGVCEGWCQSGAERSALRALAKQKWDKGKSDLEKILHKDSTREGALYGFALYFFSHANPAYDIDSAYFYISKAVSRYAGSTAEERNKLLKLPLDSAVLVGLRQKIDSVAFVRASEANTESSYTFFIQHFRHASQLEEAAVRRDEAAYLDAVKANSYQALAAFLEKYPDTKHADEARSQYEKLLFKDRTKDQRLKSYETFMADYPKSPYKHVVEKEIMELSTADGSQEKFRRFLKQYPDAPVSKRARDILYHLVQETGNTPLSGVLSSDSLRKVQLLNEGYLVPFAANGKFGFMDARGKEIIPAEDEDLYEGYQCGNIEEDIIVQNGNILSRNGAIIYQGPVAALEDLGYGFLGVENPNCLLVVHKSGFRIGDGCEQDAVVIAGRFVAVKRSDKWEIYTLAGRLLSSGWDQIKSIHSFVAIQQNDRWFLVTPQQLGLIADQQPLDLSQGFDDVKEWPHKLIWVSRGQNEAILDEDKEIRVPFGEQHLYPEIFGTLSQTTKGTKLYDHAFNASRYFTKVRLSSNWISVETEDGWKLFDLSTDIAAGPGYDSISFVGVFAAGYRKDSVRVFFDAKTHVDFNSVKLSFIPSKDSTAFLLVEDRYKKAVYNASATKLFDGIFDKIQYAGKHYFIISKKEKKGLTSMEGKQVLPVAYDAIGDVDGFRIPLLRKMKFGLFDIKTGKEVRPAYDKNLFAYNQQLIVAFRQGKWGLIDLNNRQKVPFLYDEVRYWNDSSALVRKSNNWQILEISTKKVLLDGIKHFKIVRKLEKEQIAIFQRGKEYGVLNNLRGEVIPISFTDILNIGSEEKPLYFTEKHVAEAYLFVVIYYDENGKSIRSQAFEEEEYEKIYCSNN